MKPPALGSAFHISRLPKNWDCLVSPPFQGVFYYRVVGYKNYLLAGLTLAGAMPHLSAAPISIQNILDNPPFLGVSPITNEPKPDPKPTLEIRGLVMENGVVWFTVYDSSTKKWTTVHQGEEGGALTVREYDRAKGLVVFNSQGKIIRIALNPPGGSAAPGQALARTAVASIARVDEPKHFDAAFEMVPAPSASEAKRLEQVASVIRQHLEAAKHKSAMRTQSSS